MPGTKRASNETGATTRASKAPKTDTSSTPSKTAKRTRKGGKAALPALTFQAAALPLHVNLTHTPPTIADANTEAVSAATADPGFIGNLTLVPSAFSTGSYGWKGNRRITVELQNSEDEGKREKVQVMLTINATVVGSKQAQSGEHDDTKEEEAKDKEGKDEEATKDEDIKDEEAIDEEVKNRDVNDEDIKDEEAIDEEVKNRDVNDEGTADGADNAGETNK